MSLPVSPAGQRGHIGVGTTLEYQDDTSAWVPVARVVEIGEVPLTGEAAEVDVTGYDSPSPTLPVMEKIAGMADAGSLDLTLIWIAHTSQRALSTADLREVRAWRITLPFSLGVWQADCYVTGVTLNPQLTDRIEQSATLVVAGLPTLTIPSGDGDGDGDGA